MLKVSNHTFLMDSVYIKVWLQVKKWNCIQQVRAYRLSFGYIIMKKVVWNNNAWEVEFSFVKNDTFLY